MYQNLTLPPNAWVIFEEQADFFRLLTAPAQDISIRLYARGREISGADNLGAGYAEKTEFKFDKIAIRSTGGGDIAFVLRDGSDVRYDTPPTGLVTLSGPVDIGTMPNVVLATVPHTTAMGWVRTSPYSPEAQVARVTVTNVSQQFVAQSTKVHIAIQNNSETGTIWLQYNIAAAIGTGFRLKPGEYYEPALPPYRAISMIGDIASNPDVNILYS